MLPDHELTRKKQLFKTKCQKAEQKLYRQLGAIRKKKKVQTQEIKKNQYIGEMYFCSWT